ncbi:hypothetical protein DD237_008016 [Peronospora effusa]|uniref:Uncharacterized protein n=1 Tax=Peronospora effusa TaxID=542832 RepID=A0A425BXZ7_9STRA|nr:hypothetical protein DD237_008016 [Peronospora effusa]
MSPTTASNDDNTASQAPPAIVHEKAASKSAAVVSPSAHARDADFEALAKVLEMLSGMELRMRKMEASQARFDEDEQMRGAEDSGLFSSMLGADFAGTHRGALELSDLRKRH